MTRIRIRGTKLERDRITDQTFAGVGILFPSYAERYDKNCNLNNGGAGTLRNRSTVIDRLRSLDITTETNAVVSVRPWGCLHLRSIDLSNCDGISDKGVLALAEGCHNLISINRHNCHRVSDIGISALAGGCHHLTSINLEGCYRISDVGVSTIAEGCHELTSINLSRCYII